jgi:hypothetical protein
MRRRDFIAGVGTTVDWPTAARAQTERMRRVGVLMGWSERDVIKDRELADEAGAVEANETLDAKESRKKLGDAVSRRYTAP